MHLTKIKNLSLLYFILLSYNGIGQIISNYAGSGIQGYSGDGGLASSAALNLPYEIVIDKYDNLYIADCSNNCIRKVATNGIITTIAGTGVAGFSGDGGPAVNAKLNYPVGIGMDSTGNVYFLDRLNFRIRKIDTNGIISTIAGSGTSGFGGDGGPAVNATISLSSGLTVDKSGNVYFCDQSNQRIRKIDLSGTISTIAGTGIAGFSGDGGSAVNAKVNYLLGITIDKLNNIYFADANNHRIRKISSSGVISTVAGNGIGAFAGDGLQASSASLNQPGGAMVDNSGNLFIADYANHRIRKVNQAGNISTYAGTGVAGLQGNGNISSNAQLNNPFMVAFDNTGNLYISDRSNNVIRKVTCSQPTLTLASSTPTICAGQSATLTITGTTNYNWNNGQTSGTVIVSPQFTTTYTVVGTNSVTGCSSSASIIQYVESCTGILQSSENSPNLTIYPNPSNGKITIRSEKNEIIEIYNLQGKIIAAHVLNDSNNYSIQINLPEQGIYLIRNSVGHRKIIVY